MTNVELIKSGDWENLRKVLGIKKAVEFSDTEAFIKYLTSYDLKRFLSVKANCRCIFHSDNNPSAKIKEHNGIYFYTCFSSNCKYSRPMTIVKIVMELQRKGYYYALDFLRQVFNAEVDIEGNRYYKTVKAVVENNTEIIGWIETQAPMAFGIIGNDLKLLEKLYLMCLQRPKTDKNGIPILSASTRHIESSFGKSIKPARSIAILQYFGLVEKIPLYDCDNLAPLLDYRKNDEIRDDKRLISQIRLLPLNESIFKALEETAVKFIDMHYTKRQFNFTQVALKDDIFLANELFPQK